MLKPNFFIIGAPRCGTSALSEYLKAHPEICFSRGKEPGYFCDDFLGARFSGSEEEYINRFFSHCSDKHKAVGEASVWYLYSPSAVRNIMKCNPDAKIIVMLRNPIDMVYSLHSRLLYNREEDIENFKEAWFLQDLRAAGRNIPRGCRDGRFLLYREVGCFSVQLKRVYELVPKQQVLVILFDDFIEQTKQIYINVLGFLNVSQDYCPKFERINENAVRRLNCLGEFTQQPPHFMINLAQKLKNISCIKNLRILPFLSRVNTKKQPRPPLSPKMREVLIEAFQNDIDDLSKILVRDLSHWIKKDKDNK